MTPYYEEADVTLFLGDCVDVMAQMAPESVDAICTDPPYGLEFMGKEWDRLQGSVSDGSFKDFKLPSILGSRRNVKCPECHKWIYDWPNARCQCGGVMRYKQREMQAWHHAWALEALRVLRPGGHMVCFGGTRTHHRLWCAVEDAGFEVRDTIGFLGMLGWAYGQGFPKSADVSKAIDKAAGAKREVVGKERNYCAGRKGGFGEQFMDDEWQPPETSPSGLITAPATDAARQWQGWGTALKPAWEPILLARKPIERNVAHNVQRYSTGALNIDACRVDTVAANVLHSKHEQNRGSKIRIPDQDREGHPSSGVPNLHEGVSGTEEADSSDEAADVRAGLSRQGNVGPKKRSLEGRRIRQQYGLSHDSGPARIPGRTPPSDGRGVRQETLADGSRSPHQREPIRQQAREPEALQEARETHHNQPREERPDYRKIPPPISGRWPANLVLGCTCEETLPGPPEQVRQRENEPSQDKTYNTPVSFGIKPGARRSGGGVIHTDPNCPCAMLDAQSGERASPGPYVQKSQVVGIYGPEKHHDRPSTHHGDSGGASRFYYTSKAGQGERAGGNHPTQKPRDLMLWLCKLITPPGGLILDPFIGSGTTAVAARMGGFRCIGIDNNEEYLSHAAERLRLGDEGLCQVNEARKQGSEQGVLW